MPTCNKLSYKNNNGWQGQIKGISRKHSCTNINVNYGGNKYCVDNSLVVSWLRSRSLSIYLRSGVSLLRWWKRIHSVPVDNGTSNGIEIIQLLSPTNIRFRDIRTASPTSPIKNNITTIVCVWKRETCKQRCPVLRIGTIGAARHGSA